MSAKVVIQDINGDRTAALAALLDHFGGAQKVFGTGRPVLIKPNGVNFGPMQYTTAAFLEALFALLRDAGCRDISLMENCTAGGFTRLVFLATGWEELCKRYGVKPVYLDEGQTVPFTLPDETEPISLPRFLYERLVQRRDEFFYLSAPKLKTHSMSHVTLGIKNQQGMLIDRDRQTDHNLFLGRRLVRILKAFRPDFTLVDGETGTIYGHFPSLRDVPKSTVHFKLYLGGPDVVAVDAVGAKIFGYDWTEVDHIKRAHEAGLGVADLSRVEVLGDLSRFTERYPYIPEYQFPAGLRIIYGKDMSCIQGCRGNTEAAIDLLAADYQGRGGFTFICGKGIARAELRDLPGDILVVGPCAVGEVGKDLRIMYPRRKVYCVDQHNDLASVIGKLVLLMKPWPGLSALPVPLHQVVSALIKARLRGLNSRLINPL